MKKVLHTAKGIAVAAGLAACVGGWLVCAGVYGLWLIGSGEWRNL